MEEDKDIHPQERRLDGAPHEERAGSAGAFRGRRDDRNEELDESPVPDPEAKDTDAGDDPEAD
jgi:hypothetical protein